MKVQELLELQSVITKKAIPNDMDSKELNQHYSTSAGEFNDLLDMDLIHLIRAYNKHLGKSQKFDKELIKQRLGNIIDDIDDTVELLDKQE
jgi:hypothetical protein